MPRKSRYREPTNLRKRYFSLTILLGFVVVAIVLVFFRSSIETEKAVMSDRSLLQKERLIIDSISNSRIELFRNIESFLLDPTMGHYDQMVFGLMQDSSDAIDDYIALLGPDDKALLEAALGLRQVLGELEEGIADLFESRLDVNRQFPGLALASEEMTGPQRMVAHYLQILIAEIESGELEPVSPELLTLLLKSQTLWEKQVSQYRIYLANRFASFSTEFLQLQAESLGEIRAHFMNQVENLARLYRDEDSFEGEANVQAIRETALKWYEVFLAVRKIQESENWRTDHLLLEKNVIPLFQDMSRQLSAINQVIHEREQDIDSRLEQSSNTLFALIVIIILLFLVFISSVLVSLDYMVFKPIARVSGALKSKAFNSEAPQLKVGKTREISDLVEAFQEMDEKVNQRQNELEHQALHDYLTALPNRFSLKQRLEYLLLTAERNQLGFALFFMDLNNFKDVNDTLGHVVGDKLLQQVSNRLIQNVRKSDTVARLGGDEFAVLLPNISAEDCEHVAEGMQQSMQSPFQVKGHSIPMTMSIGIVHYPEDGEDAIALLQHADSAMYQSKRKRSTFEHYDKSADFYSQNRLTLTQDLRKAIDNDDLMLFYQPQIDCGEGMVIGAEALLRWDHPQFGYINPEKIVELAEYSGIMHRLTGWVLNHAIRECGYWNRKLYPVCVSVNLSVQDLNNAELCDQISGFLQHNQLPASCLMLEITESGMMENPGLSIDTLNQLKTMGIRLSIDDFGTGFSSLKYLKQLPVDELKIDKSFVLDMEDDDNDRMIVQSTIQLGHNLGLEVVAEGVERNTLLELVNEFGCDRAQGYLIGKPMERRAFLTYLKRNERSRAG